MCLKKMTVTKAGIPQYPIDTLEEMKTYHGHSTWVTPTHPISMPKCKNVITKTSFFHPLLDPRFHLILIAVMLIVNLNFHP